MTLTEKGKRWRDTGIAVLAIVFSGAVILGAYFLGQENKNDRLCEDYNLHCDSSCVSTKTGMVCP